MLSIDDEHEEVLPVGAGGSKIDHFVVRTAFVDTILNKQNTTRIIDEETRIEEENKFEEEKEPDYETKLSQGHLRTLLLVAE